MKHRMEDNIFTQHLWFFERNYSEKYFFITFLYGIKVQIQHLELKTEIYNTLTFLKAVL